MQSAKKINIIEEVEKQLLKEDCSSLSAREIAKAAKINIAMISYYFGSKDELIEAIVKYRYNVETTKLQAYYETIKEPENLIEQIDHIIDYYAQKTFYFKTLQRLAEENKYVVEHCKPEIRNFHFTLINIFEEIINKGVALQLFTLQAETNMLVGSIVGTLLFFMKSRIFVQEFIIKDCQTKDSDAHLSKLVQEHLKTMIYLMLGIKKNNE